MSEVSPMANEEQMIQGQQQPQLIEVDTLPVVVNRNEGDVLLGTMKVWNIDKGFGFCAMDDGGQDLFVHQSAISVENERYRAILPGTKVSCVYHVREDKETATVVTLEDGKPVPGFSSKLEAAQKLSVQPMASEPGMMTGMIKFMNKEKGFGFIIPDAGGEDVFVHIGDIQGQQFLSPGEPVQYNTALKKGEKVQAVDVLCLRPRYQSYVPQMPNYQNNSNFGFQQPQYDQFAYSSQQHQYGGAQDGYGYGGDLSGRVLNGKVKWYNESKGFGFIIPETGGPDVYFKGNDVQDPGPFLQDNEPVTYETKTAPDGKMWAGAIFRARGGIPKQMDGSDGFKPVGHGYHQQSSPAQAQQYSHYGGQLNQYSQQGAQFGQQGSQFGQQGNQFTSSPGQQFSQHGRQGQQYSQSQQGQFSGAGQYYQQSPNGHSEAFAQY